MSIIEQPNIAPARMRAEAEILMLVTSDFPPPTTAVGKLCSHNTDNNTMNNIIMSAGLEKNALHKHFNDKLRQFIFACVLSALGVKSPY